MPALVLGTMQLSRHQPSAKCASLENTKARCFRSSMRRVLTEEWEWAGNVEHGSPKGPRLSYNGLPD